MIEYIKGGYPLNIKIIPAKDELNELRQLFREYSNSLDIDLCFQDFEQELNDLPGKYSEPDGRLYIALLNDQVAGCVALRRNNHESAELKRLFIRNGFRGLGISKRLIQKVIQESLDIGYHSILLDTLDTMMPAISLYKSFGFEEIKAYYPNPIEGAIYLKLDLKK